MTEPIVFLEHSTDSIEDTHVLMTLRSMAGQDIHMAVKRTAIIWDVRHYVAIQMGLISSDIHLVLDYKELDNNDRIYTIQPLLEAKGNVVDILMESGGLSSTYFECPNCNRYCNLHECIDWSEDPSQRCNHPDHGGHYCCYGRRRNVEEQEEQEQENQE